MKNKKIFLTGGAGFIGANLIRRLLLLGADIHVLIRKSTDTWRLDEISGRINFHIGDLSDIAGLKKIAEAVKPDGIFHLGAITIMSGVISEPGKVEAINVAGTKNLVHALADVDYDFFINTSTFTENAQDDYAKSKKEAAGFCADYAKKNKKPIVTLRLFTPYGPFIQKGRLIFNVLSKAMRGDDIEMTSPEIGRDFIYVDDLIDLYFAAARYARENSGEAFNAGSGVLTTLKEAADAAMKITNGKSVIRWGALGMVSYDSGVKAADIGKTISALGWQPKTSFENGLKMTYGWLKQNLHLYK